MKSTENIAIRFKPHQVSGEVASQAGSRKLYRSLSQYNFKVTPEEFASVLADRLGHKGDVAFGHYVLDTIPALASELLNQGARVDLGWIQFAPRFKGSLTTVDEQISADRIEVKVSLSHKFRHSISNLVGVSTVNPDESVIYTVQESSLLDLNVLKTPGAEVVITGRGILINPERTDEGVWLEDAKGKLVSRANLLACDHLSAEVQFATLPSKGRYQLILSTRNGKDTSHGTIKHQRWVEVNPSPLSADWLSKT